MLLNVDFHLFYIDHTGHRHESKTHSSAKGVRCPGDGVCRDADIFIHQCLQYFKNC